MNRRLRGSTWLFPLGVMVAMLAVSSAFGAPLTFTIDSTQSTLTGSGTLGGAAINEQGPGSLTTRFGGTLTVVLDDELNPTTLQITSLSMNALTNGLWSPLPGGGVGTAAANMAATASSVLFSGNVALRNLVVTGLTPAALPLASSHFTSTSLQFTLTNPSLDYNATTFLGPISGTQTLAAYTTNNIAGAGSLTYSNNTATLTIPINFLISKSISGVPLLFTCSGVLISTSPVAGPTPPAAQFSGAPTTGAAPLNVLFTDSSTGSITNRSWTFGDGSTTNTAATSVAHVYLAAGTNTVGLTASGPGGSSSTNRLHYIIVTSTNEPPDTAGPVLAILSPADFQTFASSPIMVTGTVTDASGVNVVTVNGAVATLNGNNWSKSQALATGTNTLTVIARDNSANDNATTQTVHAVLTATPPPAPVAGFTANPTNGIAPLLVTFADASTGTIATRLWSFGDGGASSSLSPSHTYTNAGTFSVGLTVTGPGGSNTLNQAQLITVTSTNGPAAPQITAGPVVTNALLRIGNVNVVVAGDTNVFSVGATDPQGLPLTYAWSFGDGATSPASIESTALHAYATNACGPFLASVTVSNTAAGTVSNLTASVACALTISKPTGKLAMAVNFAKANADSASLTTVLDLGAGFVPANQTLTLDIGGAQLSLVLNAKGKGTGALGTCQLVLNKKTGTWKLTGALKKGTWRDPWALHGLHNVTTPKTGAVVQVPVLVVVGGEAFMTEQPLTYKATAGKSGSAK